MKKNTSGSDNKNSSTSKSNNSSSSTTSNSELFRQLEELNLVLDTLLVLILGVLLNFYSVYIDKLQVLDQINNTNLADNLIDIKDIPKISFAIFVYVTGTFLEVNYREYINTINSKENCRTIKKAYISFFASLILFIGTIISGSNNLET